MTVILRNDVDYGPVDFPSGVDFAFSKAELAELFQINQDLWTSQFSRKKLEALVVEVRDGSSWNHDQEVQFKKIRARLKQLRFAFGLFSSAHEYPEMVHEVTQLMGEVQDALRNSQTAILRKRAKELSKLLRGPRWDEFEAQVATFKPSSGLTFRSYLAEQVEFLRQHNSAPITGKTFHEMRKVVSRLVALFSTAVVMDPKPEHQAALEYLATLNGRMGRMHDNLVTLRFAGLSDYEQDPFELPEDIQAHIFKLVFAFNRILGS